jgi:ubiquinone/menaquinone biosynthesis C-methylase UbiE
MSIKAIGTVEEPSDPTVSFFDDRASAYDREYHDHSPGGYALRVRREKVLKLFDQHGGKVLDVGCGPGVMAEEIVSRGCTFCGVDPSQKMLEICRRRFVADPRMRFFGGDATRLELPDESFDAVLCMGVIDAVRDRRQAVREMLRVLRPGGTLLITFTNLRSPYSWWKTYVFYPAVTRYHALRRRSASYPRLTLPPRDRALYERKTALNLLQTEGGDVLEVVGYYFNVFLAPLDELFPSLALWVTRQLEEGRLPRPEWLAGGWIVKARKNTKQ